MSGYARRPARSIEIFLPIGHRNVRRGDGRIERREIFAPLNAANNQNRSVAQVLRDHSVDVVDGYSGDVVASHCNDTPHPTLLHKAWAHRGTLRTVGNLNSVFRKTFRECVASCSGMTRSHPRARKITDVIQNKTPATAATNKTIIKSSQSKDIIYPVPPTGSQQRPSRSQPPASATVVAQKFARMS